MSRCGILTGLFLILMPLMLCGEESGIATQRPARLIVFVPAEAVLTINGYATQQTGPRREFETPLLKPGRTYTYLLRAQWRENGADVAVEREVAFRAGETVHIVLEKSASGPKIPTPVRRRNFLFRYEVTVKGLKPGTPVRLWLPVASTNPDQEVEVVEQKLPPNSHAEFHTEPKYQNRILFIQARSNAEGTIPVSVTYRVSRREVRMDEQHRFEGHELAQLFLGPDTRVPVGGKALRLIEGKPLPTDQLRLARVLYDVVNAHMVYSKKGVGWGQGDADWACENGYGNCTDFHSLFIALARAQGIPAHFEIGFPLPEQRGEGEVAGYHCWAWFKPEGRGWIPVDISEANKVKNTRPEMVEYYFGNLTPDRVTFSQGRDLNLVPRQSGPPLNFFIYPYAEVDGRPVDASQIERRFSYKDLP